MSQARHSKLATRLAVVVIPLLLFALLSSVTMMWFSWRLEGATAARAEVNRLHRGLYRTAMLASTGAATRLAAGIAGFEADLAQLRTDGGPRHRILMPPDEAVQASLRAIEQAWPAFSAELSDIAAMPPSVLHAKTDAFAGRLTLLESAIDAQLARWRALLNILQLATIAVAVLAAAVLVYAGYRFVLEPMGLLGSALREFQEGNLTVRVPQIGSREFDGLADGFNAMAGSLQSMYHDLESRVAGKTAQLEDERERLEALYDVTSLIANASTLDELARGFADRIVRVAHADGVALRWSDEANERFLMLAASGLPQSITSAERCIPADGCHCGNVRPVSGMRVIALHDPDSPAVLDCVHAGFRTMASIPIRLKERLMGEVDLFFHARVEPPKLDRSLLETLAAHLAGAMENLRLNALATEAAVSGERTLLAGELHDSIAQSLAFLKIQVQLMHDALADGDTARMRAVLAEIGVGIGESYSDVRELLVHFRTRTNAEDIEPALLTTLRKFELQSGLRTSLRMRGDGMPLAPDLQLQVLHIVQEALSNVRKHAGASRVWIDVRRDPCWQFEVRDDGVGFSDSDPASDETHVGLRIMAERAERIGARLDVDSTPGRGTSVALTLPETV